MLISLHVKNLALIEEEEICFGPALNILTGETGAGKSVLIGSMNLALGAKADKELIRQGAEYALIELLFQIEQPHLQESIRQLELPIEEDGMLLIQRKIMANRSTSKVNGESVVAKQLKQLAALVMDIHGQNEHQSLLHATKQKQILDAFAGEALQERVEKIADLYQEYKAVQAEIQETDKDQATRKRELDLAEYELQEIQGAALKEGEDEALEATYQKMKNAQKIHAGLGTAYGLCVEGTENASEYIGHAVREFRSIVGYDEQLSDLEGQLLDIESLLRDFGRQTYDYMQSLAFDDEQFSQVEERLNVINHLKGKYGNSIAQILAYGESLGQQIDRLQNGEVYFAQLAQRKEKLEAALREACQQATQMRQTVAQKLAAQMKEALLELNFLDVQFQISLESGWEHLGADGWDTVSYQISTNPGEPLKALSQVASGGELSRIMLALKTVLAEQDKIETLIFDEIDAGISGKTAWRVAEKIGALGQKHQILCITHLPQIAAMANTHFFIEKLVDAGHAVTRIREVQEEESIREIARLLGGDEITQISIENARELKQASGKK